MFKKVKIKKIFLLFLFIFSVPMLGFINKNTDSSNLKNDNSIFEDKTVKINYDGQISEISTSEYLKGVLAAEMPSSFETEAKKAQVVAAHTYAINRYGYDGVYDTSPSIFQAYISEDKRKDKFKDNFYELEQNLDDIVKEVENKILVYDEKPIVAAFFSMSGGKTENSSNVFGGNLPYLTMTDSQNETNLPNFLTETTIDSNKLKTILENNIPNLNFKGDPKDEISILSRDESDYVSTIQIEDKQISGTKFRSLFGLASANFTISKVEGGLKFVCKGKGHGVGMSQYGANELAKSGMNYQDILKYYYKNTNIKDI